MAQAGCSWGSCVNQGLAGAALVAADCLGSEDGEGAVFAGDASLWDGWRGTNMSDEQSFQYHYEKQGKRVSPQQYADDARAFREIQAGRKSRKDIRWRMGPPEQNTLRRKVQEVFWMLTEIPLTSGTSNHEWI